MVRTDSAYTTHRPVLCCAVLLNIFSCILFQLHWSSIESLFLSFPIGRGKKKEEEEKKKKEIA
jgi:hypothetical protein